MSRLVRWTGLAALAALAMGSCGEGTGGVRVEPVDAPQESAGGDLPDSPDACVPKCAGKECGPDGCGRACGYCGGDETCDAGRCVAPCVPSCEGRECGTDGCGGDCGRCKDGKVCNDGKCGAACVPACEGKACGGDGCGGECGRCGEGTLCVAPGTCRPSPTCAEVTKVGCCDGDALWLCVAGKVQTQDCAAAPACGWSASEGGYACGTDGGAAPGGMAPKDCAWVCHPACEGKECGPNGCGAACGICDAGEACSASGKCVGGCSKACDGKECGPDGCGGSCGECADDATCNELGKCVDDCKPSCEGKACGGDGCGGPCPPGCKTNEHCEAGKCLPGCTPSCGDRECGDDGCGGSCGKCPDGVACTIDGRCGTGCAACSLAPECVALDFESGNLSGWTVLGDAAVVTKLGATAAPEGKYMLELSNAQDQDGQVEFRTCVPGGTTALRFRWRLYSEEFEEWCGSDFQDFFEARLLTPSGKETIAFTRTIDELCRPGSGESLCTTCGAHFAGLSASDVDFDQGDVLATPWQTAVFPMKDWIAGAATVPLTIRLIVGDKGDAIFETHVLIDEIEFMTGCTPDCLAATCGPDGCGRTCGDCVGTCAEGVCECKPSCTGKECGDDGCGSDCGECAAGKTCVAGKCGPAPQPGAPCTKDEECGTGGLVCRNPKPAAGPTKYCTTTCDLPLPTNCPAGWTCEPDALIPWTGLCAKP